MKTNLFANHEQALKFRALRNQVLSSNIANADTPNYKARDIDFGSALEKAQSGALRNPFEYVFLSDSRNLR